MSVNILDPIKKGLGNVKKAVATAAADTLGSVTYAVKLAFILDPQKLKRAKEKRRAALERIGREYSELWQSIVKANPDMSFIASVAAPGPYLMAYLAMNASVDTGIINAFIEKSGLDTSLFRKMTGTFPPKPSPQDPGMDIRTRNEYERMHNMLIGDTSGIPSSDVITQLRKIGSILERAVPIGARGRIEESSGQSDKKLSFSDWSKTQPENIKEDFFNYYSKILKKDLADIEKIKKSATSSIEFIELSNRGADDASIKSSFEKFQNSIFYDGSKENKNFKKEDIKEIADKLSSEKGKFKEVLKKLLSDLEIGEKSYYSSLGKICAEVGCEQKMKQTINQILKEIEEIENMSLP